MILGCEGLADYHCGLQSLEVPVSSGTRLHTKCSFAAHVGAKCARWKAEDWCELGTLSSDGTGFFCDNTLVNSPDNKEEVIGDSSGLCPDDSEGIALYIDLPCSPCKDSAEFAYIRSPEQFLLVEGPKGGIAGPALPTDSHEQLKMTSQAEVSQRSESNISPNLTSHVLRSFLETDNAPRFKRWWQVTAIDQNPESASYMLKKPEILPNLKMSTSPVKEGLVVERVPGGDVHAGLEEPEFTKDSGGDQHRNCRQEESPYLIVEKTEAKIPPNLGTHALRALMEADNVQKLKRRRLTRLADSALVKDSKDVSDGNSPDVVSRQPSDLPVSKESKIPEESLPSPDSDGLPVHSSSAQSDVAQDIKYNAGSGNCNSEIASSGILEEKDGTFSDSSESSSHSHDTETLDKYIIRPARYSSGGSADVCSKKKDWLGQHHGGNLGGTGIAQDKSFAGNVGGCYRSAIDKRPAAPHPGFVGDGATVQFCKICGEREDATSSLICDSCEEVFHMGCINVRMKIVPRVDEWLCRPCKKKRKMGRESENHGDSEPGGEPKDWWREDSRIGRVERELLRMSNGRRLKVRLGPKFQADILEWTGRVDDIDLTKPSYRFGQEVSLTSEEKRLEQETADYNLANSIWPRGWAPATQLPPGSKENWIKCTLVLFDEGEICPDGSTAEKDIVCGKWRRAPLGIVPDDQWECSCALVWDPRHAECAVPQELSTEEINERMKSAKLSVQEEPTYV